jgi:cytochrome d ubiquinol oxidase subunit I
MGFHIIFATIGVGLPLLLLLAEGIGVWCKDPHYILLAKRWARGLGIFVSIEVVTGTIVSLLFSFLWPNFMRVAGHAISLPLFLYTFAFFLEAFFLAIYLYSWGHLKPLQHWLLTIPIFIGGCFTGVFFTIINAFMNTPGGVTPIEVLFNAAMPSMVFHVLSSSFLTAAFILAAITAYRILRGKTHTYYIKGLRISMLTGLFFSIINGISGIQSISFMEQFQPDQLRDSMDELQNFYYFMTFTGIYLIIISSLYLFILKNNKWLMGFIVLGGVFSFLSIEFGWIFTEVGRQPWVLQGNLLSEAGVTMAKGVGIILFLFAILYFFLGSICCMTLIRLFTRHTPEIEMKQLGIS